MGNPDLTNIALETIDVSKGNTTVQDDKEIIKIVKRHLTKKEYKSFFTLVNESDEHAMEQLQCTAEELATYRTKARKKLRNDVCKNEILRLLKIIK